MLIKKYYLNLIERLRSKDFYSHFKKYYNELNKLGEKKIELRLVETVRKIFIIKKILFHS